MNLTVLGATGPTGTQLVEQALAADHHVTALARSPEKLTITNPNLHVVQGDATDRAAVSQAMKGADAVISTLGAKGSVIAASTAAAPSSSRDDQHAHTPGSIVGYTAIGDASGSGKIT